MVAIVEGLRPFELQGSEAVDLKVIGLYDILPNNEIIFVAIDREENLERENNFLFNNSQSEPFLLYRF